MTNDELKAKYSALLTPGGLFTVHSVDQCNFKVDGLKGHPFTIGPKHVEYASDHCGGMLGNDVMEKIGCAHHDKRFAPQCGRPLHAHTSDKVLFLILMRDMANKEAGDALFVIKEEMIADKIDGVAFMEGPYKIAKPL